MKRRLGLALAAAAGFLGSTVALAFVSDESERASNVAPYAAPELRVEPAIVFSAPAASSTRAFFESHSAEWDVRWDLHSDRPHLIQGRGVPLVPGRGNALRAEDVGLPAGRPIEVSDLEPLLRRFLSRFPELFRLSGIELVLDRERSVRVAGGSDVWSIELGQVRGGVPVRGAKVYFRINSGNIVQLGTELLSEVRIDPVPKLTREDALAIAVGAIGVEADALAGIVDPGTLEILPTLPPGEEGYRHRLVWSLAFVLADDIRTHGVIVDAHDGEVLRVFDRNAYTAATVSGGIYPRTNTDPEEIRGLPYASVANNGTKVTDAGGIYDYTGGTASTSLDGEHISIDDACGAISRSDSATGNLAFGTSGGTDCATPGIGGPGNTHAARTSFYHLARVNRKAAHLLPGNAWLEGKLDVQTNLTSSTCNAHWNGTSVLLYHAGSGCSNTGEIASIVVHEWGHGLDDNTGGIPADLASAEASADTYAMLETRDGCIGPNFIQGVQCHNCEACTGARDVSDFDLTGPGVIARPSTITSNLGIDCDRWSCPSSGGGPIGYQGYCESYIASSANWDLAQSLVATHGVDAGWARMELLWYGSLAPAGRAYRLVSGSCASAVVDGCLASNWYTAYLAVDDDNGNLADGTPNACRIWDAFDAHGIACGARPACSAGASCGTPSCPLSTCSAPLPPASECPIDTLAFTGKTSLAWTAPAGCARPLVYDTAKGDLDCLRRTCRPIAQSVPVCLSLENDSPDTIAADAAVPPPGTGFWYLSRVDGGTWNSTGAGQCTDYGASLPLGCP